MEILSKDMIDHYILPNLSVGIRGKACSPDLLSGIVGAVLYRLKTGCQWRYLPVNELFTQEKLSWSGVYYHFNKWVQDGSWQKVWVNILLSHRQSLDLSCIQLDGSHSPAQRGGEAVGYQGRKSSQTSNTLYLADNQGQMLACASPQAGQHHDLFKIQELFEQICGILQEADIDLSGLFLNADAGFDSQDFRQLCSQKGIEANIEQNKRNQKTVQEHVDYQYFDEELYKRRTVIEHANAWMDNFKALLIRFETKAKNWTALLFIGFTVRFLTKIYKKRKL